MNYLLQSVFRHEDSLVAGRLVKQLNYFRRQVEIILPYLERRKENYSLNQKRNILFSPYHPYQGLQTVQGVVPIDQLYEMLGNIKKKLPDLVQNPILSLIAKNVVSTFTSIRQLSQLKLSQTHAQQLRRELNNCSQYDFVDKVTCLIGVGFDKEEFEPLLSLLIDDGDKMRRNRSVLLDENMKYIGVGTSTLKHKPQLQVAAYLLTGNITNK